MVRRRPVEAKPAAAAAAPERWPCLVAHADGVLLHLSVVPNAGRTEPAGLHDGTLRVRLAAPAIEGRANDALLQWLAAQLGLARRHVELVAGASARRKRVLLRCDAAIVRDWLERCVG